MLRAGIGYALGEDAIGLNRLRERYVAKMVDGSARRAFEVVASPAESRSAEFSVIATNVGSIDTLDRFLLDLKAGFSDLAGVGGADTKQTQEPPQSAAPAAAPTAGQAPTVTN